MADSSERTPVEKLDTTEAPPPLKKDEKTSIPSASEMRATAEKGKERVPTAPNGTTDGAPAPVGGPSQIPQTRQVPVEHGPLTLKDACVVVAAKYNGMFTQMQYQLEPVVRDGSVVKFMAGGGQMELATAVLRTSPEIVYDDKQNAFLALLVYNISYPRQPTPVRFA